MCEKKLLSYKPFNSNENYITNFNGRRQTFFLFWKISNIRQLYAFTHYLLEPRAMHATEQI